MANNNLMVFRWQKSIWKYLRTAYYEYVNEYLLDIENLLYMYS